MKIKKRPIDLCRLGLAAVLAGSMAARAVEPPLPGEDGPRRGGGEFQPLLQPGDELPPESIAPPVPDGPAVLPPELFPDIAPGGSDGIDGLPDATVPGGLPEPLTPGADGLLPPPALPGLPLPPPPSAPVSVPGLELAARAYWHRSPLQAREVSKLEKKPLMIFFYQKWKSAPMAEMDGAGSGDRNIAMNDDLLSSRAFNEFMAGRVVLTRLFYPIGSPSEKDFPPAKMAALKNFKEHFKVRGFPALVLLDENGRVIERQDGYNRRKMTGETYVSTAAPILERFKSAVTKREAVVAADRERLERLLAQNYREWTSHTGSRLMARFVSASADQVVLMDEHGALLRVAPEQLTIVDRAIIRRQYKGLAGTAGQTP